MFSAGEIVFAEQRFFIQAQVARDGAHESMAKNAAGQLVPIFIFESVDEAGADARGFDELLDRDFAHFALAFQAFTEISPGHEPEPVLDYPRATAKRSIARAAAQRLTPQALAKKTEWDPSTDYRRVKKDCQTMQKGRAATAVAGDLLIG